MLVASHGWRVDIFHWKNPNPKKTKDDSINPSRSESRYRSSSRPLCFLPPPPRRPLPHAPGISHLILSSSALQSAHTNTHHTTHTLLLTHRFPVTCASHITPALTNTTHKDLANQRSIFQWTPHRWSSHPRRMLIPVPFPARTPCPVQTRTHATQTSSHHPCPLLRALWTLSRVRRAVWAEPRAGRAEVGRVTPPWRTCLGHGDSVIGKLTDPVRNGRSCEHAQGAQAGRKWNDCSDVNEGDERYAHKGSESNPSEAAIFLDSIFISN